MINSILLASSIVLSPCDDCVGVIDDLFVCDFRYSPSTIFAPITRITVDPYTEHYGNGSVVHPDDGLSCRRCEVIEIRMVGVQVIIDCK